MSAAAHHAWRSGLLVVLMTMSTLMLTDRTLAQSSGTVRGKILWCTSPTSYPAASLRVALVRVNGTGSSLSYTAADGFYYFHAIPGGDYLLKIYRGGSSNPLTYRIHVFDQPHTDINPICLR